MQRMRNGKSSGNVRWCKEWGMVYMKEFKDQLRISVDEHERLEGDRYGNLLRNVSTDWLLTFYVCHYLRP